MNENAASDAAAGEKVEYELKKSPVPLIAVGVFWVVYALIFPLWRWYHFIIPAALSPVVNLIFERFFPPVRTAKVLPYKTPESGDAAVDKVITDAAVCLKEVESSAAKIAPKNPSLATDAGKLVGETHAILDYLAKNAQKVTLLRRFFNYYLPTLDKLLKTYIVLDENGAGIENAEQSKREIAESVKTMEDVFKKQRAKLLDDVTLDISAEISVLENMLGKSPANSAPAGGSSPAEGSSSTSGTLSAGGITLDGVSGMPDAKEAEKK